MAEPQDSQPSAGTRRGRRRSPARRRGPLDRRLGLLGGAALLAGSVALTGTTYPDASPAKTVTGAYLSEEVILEATVADVDADGEGVEPELRLSAMTLVAHAAPVKAAHDNPLAEPVCVSYPVTPGAFRLSSPYGYRTHPIFGTYSMHMGVDFAAPLGTPIHAVADGIVVYTGAGRLGRSSELVIIEHTVADTTFYSWYVHMYPDGVFVEVDQRVGAGEVIAEVGNNGNSTGPHLHFEIHTEPLEPNKTPGRRTPLSTHGMVGGGGFNVLPGDSPWPAPSPEPDESALPEPDESPSPEPGESPSPEPGESPSPEPGESPSPEPGESPSPEPGESPSPEPDESPSPEPDESPSPEPSESPSPEPAESPSPESGETPSPGESVDPTDPADDDARPRHPFPVQAYGTTVDPMAFLASLGLAVMAPQQCAAP